MTFTEKQISRLILSVLILLTAVLGVITYVHPMAIFPDPSWGFQVMRSMEKGAGFNMLVAPDQGDVNHNYSEFLSWWSPGQYLAPYFFRSILHCNIGQACALTILVSEVLGLLGFYAFFRKAGFSQVISALSILFIASQIYYLSPYVFYNGGEVLLFGFAGWFLYGSLSFNKAADWRLLLFILLSGLIGFCCKSSFLWIYGAGLCYIWIRISMPDRKPLKWIINGIWMAVPAIISLAIIYFGYLSKGDIPTSQHRPLQLLWETFGFPIASPLLAGFSIDDLTQGLLFHPDGAMFSYPVAVLIIVILAIISIWIFMTVRKKVPYTDYQLILTVFYIAAILFFGYSYLKQMAISYEGRHLRLIGLMFIPGIIYLISRLKAAYKTIFGLIWIGMLALSLQYLIHGYGINKDENSHGVSGITQQFLDQTALDTLIKLDNTHRNALFVFISPDLGLEVQHNRVITLQPIGPDLKVNYNDYQHCGHAGPLYIFLPSEYQGVRATMIRKSFEDYKGFHLIPLGTDYVIFAAP